MDREYLETLIKDLGQMLTSETVIGEPMVIGKVTILPVVAVSFGLGSGSHGTQPSNGTPNGNNEKKTRIAAASAGAKLTPVAFLSVHEDGTVNLHQIQTKGVGTPVDRLLEMAPGFIDKLSATFSKDSKPLSTPIQPEEKRTPDEIITAPIEQIIVESPDLNNETKHEHQGTDPDPLN